MARTLEIRARCTERTHKALALLAEQEGIKDSEMLRQLVRDAAKKAGLWGQALEDQKETRDE
jgi:hypothetical protein